MQDADEGAAFEVWWEEHSELDRLVSEFALALNDGGAVEARKSLELLTETFENHFSLEELVYFPIIEALSAENAEKVRAVKLGHGWIRNQLERLAGWLEAGDLVAGREGFETLLDRFRQHEAEEERIVHELTGSKAKDGGQRKGSSPAA